MSGTYTTIQGDTWDSIAYDLYGDEKYMKYLIEANWSLLETLVFSSGTVLSVPDLPVESDDDLPFWHSSEDNDDDIIEDYLEEEDEDDG